MGVQEVVTLPRKSKPAPPARALRFSARKFAEAWTRKRAADPTFRSLALMTAAGVESNTLRNWRAGRTEPSATQAMALAAVLGVGPLDLFE